MEGLRLKYLYVVAHPDDEVLGAGGSIFRFAERGNQVSVCFMSGDVRARAGRPEDFELNNDICAGLDVLGVSNVIKGCFPNIEFNVIPHLQLVQFVENVVISSDADVVITHHPSDSNNDHLHTFLACQAAIRLFQRRSDVKPLNELWLMEVLSASEWSVNSALNRFSPNTYIEIGETGVEQKIKALNCYKGVMRDYPHPRSNETIKGLAAYRGSQAGIRYAEAFECVFRRITT